MWLATLRNLVFGPRSPRRPAGQRRRTPLRLERLEDRALPSAYTAGSVADLIADINAANAAGGSNTITLVAGKTFSLAAVNNTTDGATGLPVIAVNDNLTIVGNGDTIQRSTARGTPAFRLLDVAAGASLTLNNLTLQGGLATGFYSAAYGGAIYNQGTLLLNGVTVQNNIAQGGFDGFEGKGGGIFSSGSLTLQGSTIQNNQAVGGSGIAGQSGPGNGRGGGLFVDGGSATLLTTIVEHNSAQGGQGGTKQGAKGEGIGGGIYIDFGVAVCLDIFTQSHVIHNKASTSDPNIHGSYTTCS